MRKQIVMTLANGLQIAVKARMEPPGDEHYDVTASEIALGHILEILELVRPEAFIKQPQIQAAKD